MADQARGPFTTAEDCSPPEPWETNGEPAAPPKPTGPRAFICAVRQQNALPFAATAPDQVLLDHGRRLCAAYTRNDPRELAHMREAEVNVRDLSGVLAGICPAANAEIAAAEAAEEREFNEFMAEEQRKCDATPRHRPLIRPAKAIRLKEPEWPEAGLEPYDEFSAEDRSTTSGPVTAGPGHVMVSTHSDFHVWVTLETYTRRPPVETKGWDYVVEVGYANQSGDMSFIDGLRCPLRPLSDRSTLSQRAAQPVQHEGDDIVGLGPPTGAVMGRADAVQRHHHGTGIHVVAHGAVPYGGGHQVGDSLLQRQAALGEGTRAIGHERGQRPGQALVGGYVVDHAAEEGRQSLRRGQRSLQPAGAVAQRGDFPVVDRLGQCLPGGEVAVQRAGAHPGQACEVVEAQVEEAAGVEDLSCLGDQGIAVALGVGPQRLVGGHVLPRVDKWR
ncbi:hypothetical protein OG320_30850 [Microbispora sp. NBC_01189]|nr:hypothetical protein OG320_30850 [Microbispora sp. NBC_01189]